MPVTPVYLRIVEDIQAKIASGEWPPGRKLDPPAVLAQHYAALFGVDVSPQTVRRSTDYLQIRGELIGRQGAGVYVAGDPPPPAA